MTTAEKLQKSAEYMERLDAKNKELEKRLNGGKVVGGSYQDKFWDAWQDYGNRTDYRYSFAGKFGYIYDYIKLNYDIHPQNASRMFESSNLTEDVVIFFEKQGVILDFSNTSDFTWAFSNSAITHIGVIDTRSANDIGYIIGNANYLITVDKVILKNDGTQKTNSHSFSCKNIQNITFEGVIGQNIWFSACTKLTTASLLSILTALSKDSTLATGKTITLATAHKAKIESDAACTAQINAAIAAGWTVAYV